MGFLVVLLVRNDTRDLFISETGLDAEQKILIAKSQSWLAAGKFDSATVYANALTMTAEGASQGYFLLGVIACRKADFETAFTAFESASQTPNGSRLLQKNRMHIVILFMPLLKKKRASDPIVALLAKKCLAAEVPSIKNAVYERPYWLRWNSLRILQATGRQVDLVRVFILDLKYSRTMKCLLKNLMEPST